MQRKVVQETERSRAGNRTKSCRKQNEVMQKKGNPVIQKSIRFSTKMTANSIVCMMARVKSITFFAPETNSDWSSRLLNRERNHPLRLQYRFSLCYVVRGTPGAMELFVRLSVKACAVGVVVVTVTAGRDRTAQAIATPMKDAPASAGLRM